MPVTKALESKIITSPDGIEIYGEAVGDPTKPHIVFVHGFTLSCDVFDKIFHDAQYQQRYYLIRFDTRGHGRSGKPDSMDGHSSKIYADDFLAVCKTFELTRPTVVGWSLGGILAADIATYLPKETLAGAVYIGSFFSTSHIPLYATSFASEQVAVITSPESPPRELRAALVSFSDGVFDDYSDCEPYSPEKARLKRLRRWDIQSTWLGYGVHQTTLDRAFTVGRHQDSTKLFEMGKEGFPILILHGTKDALIRPEQLVKDAQEHFPNAKIALIEKGGSHAVFHDNPSETMEHIGAFVDEIQKSL